LYDLETDPDELSDLAGSPDHEKTLEHLKRKLVDWFARYAVPSRDASVRPVFGRGQIDRVENPTNHTPPFSDDWFSQSSGKHDDGPTL
jgi:hypothetical protein